MIPQIPKNREDIRYGDPHNPRGSHTLYGPDSFDIEAARKPKQKPAMESHGFYLVSDSDQPPMGWWKRTWRFLRSKFN